MAAAVGRKASTGHKSTQSTRQNGRGVHQAGLDSTPEACKCTRGHSQHREGEEGGRGGDFTGSGCWLSAAVLIKKGRMGPGSPVSGLMMEQFTLSAEDLHLYCIRLGKFGGYGSGLDF